MSILDQVRSNPDGSFSTADAYIDARGYSCVTNGREQQDTKLSHSAASVGSSEADDDRARVRRLCTACEPSYRPRHMVTRHRMAALRSQSISVPTRPAWAGCRGWTTQ